MTFILHQLAPPASSWWISTSVRPQDSSHLPKSSWSKENFLIGRRLY